MKTDKIIEFVQAPDCFIKIESLEKLEDGSGFCSILSIQSGIFSCQGHPFLFNDLKQFSKDLTRVVSRLEGQAKLGPEHEPEFILFKSTELGTIIVRGELIESGEQILRFSFETEPRFLQPFLGSIKTVLESLK